MYRQYRPRPELAPYLEFFWQSSGAVNSRTLIVPDLRTDIVVRGESSVREVARGPEQARPAGAWIVGTMTGAFAVQGGGDVLIGARFKPGAAGAFFPMPQPSLTDSSVRLSDCWGAFGRELEARILEAERPVERMEFLQEGLRSRLRDPTKGDRLARALTNRLIQSGGTVRVATLSQWTGYSRQHLTRVFKRAVGIDPKRFGRIARFRGALGAIERDSTMRLADLAAEFRYADEAHLIRDFKEFTGTTPAAWRQFHFINAT